MNVAGIIVEQLEWDGKVRTVHYRAPDRPEMWIADADEYHDRRSGPFHFLEDADERRYRKQMRHARAREAASLVRGDDGWIYSSQWRGISTVRGAQTAYAFALPPGAAPMSLTLTDPRNGRAFGFSARRDEQLDRIVAYLSCRSRYGSFDFDLHAVFLRDAERFDRFEPIVPINEPWLPDLEDMADFLGRGTGRDRDRIVFQQFLAGSIHAAPGSVVVKDAQVKGEIAAVSGSARVGSLGRGSRAEAHFSQLLQSHRHELLADLDALVRAGVPRALEAREAAAAGDDSRLRRLLSEMGTHGAEAAQSVGAGVAAGLILAALGVG